jgi:hypothetical protein
LFKYSLIGLVLAERKDRRQPGPLRGSEVMKNLYLIVIESSHKSLRFSLVIEFTEKTLNTLVANILNGWTKITHAPMTIYFNVIATGGVIASAAKQSRLGQIAAIYDCTTSFAMTFLTPATTF